MNKLISIIVPVYNKEKVVRRCVESILKQTYKNIEVIIVDDGSKDNSLKICRQLELNDSRIKVIYKKNGGVSSARNEGLKIAQGQYIGFVDSDDWIENNMYEKLYKAMIKNDADIASCYFTYEKNGLIEEATYKQCKFKDETCLSKEECCIELTKIYNRHIGWENCNKLFNKRVLKNIKFDSTITNGEDWLFFCSVLSVSKKIVYIPNNLYHYVYEENSASNFYRNSYLSACKASEKVLKLNLPFTKKSENNIKESIAQTASLCLYNWRKRNDISIKDIKEAQKYIKNYRKYVYLNKEVRFKRKIKFFIYSKSNIVKYKKEKLKNE